MSLIRKGADHDKTNGNEEEIGEIDIENLMYRNPFYNNLTKKPRAGPLLILKPISEKIGEDDFTEFVQSCERVDGWRHHGLRSENFATLVVSPNNNNVIAMLFLDDDKNIIAIETHVLGQGGERAIKSGLLQQIWKNFETNCRDKFVLCLTPCYGNRYSTRNYEFSTSCMIPKKEFVLDNSGRAIIASAVCPEHGLVLPASIISKWFPDVVEAETLRIRAIDMYLEKVSRLITDDEIFVDVGLELGLNFNDLEAILVAHGKRQAFAACRLLMDWRKMINISDLETVKQKMKETFSTLQLGSKFEELTI